MICRLIDKILNHFENKKGSFNSAVDLEYDKAIARKKNIEATAHHPSIVYTNARTLFKPIDIRNSLPYHPTRKWRKRLQTHINKIIFHQSMSGGTVEGINEYHVNPDNHISKRGCPHIVYTYVINPAGAFYQCNDILDITYHCKDQNLYAIGVLVIGDFPGPGYTDGTDLLNKDQKITIVKAGEYLRSIPTLPKLYRAEKSAVQFGHCDFGKKYCPGNEIYKLIRG